MKYLVGLIEAGELEPLIAEGMTPDLLDALRNRSMRDLTRIAEDSSIGFYLAIDAQRLSTSFLRLDAVLRDTKLLEYFVAHGAPSMMITRLFSVSGHTLRPMREVLCPEADRAGGRPKMAPDTSVRDLIHKAWAQITGNSKGLSGLATERENIYALSQLFPDYSIGSLWTVVNEFEDEHEQRVTTVR